MTVVSKTVLIGQYWNLVAAVRKCGAHDVLPTSLVTPLWLHQAEPYEIENLVKFLRSVIRAHGYSA